MYGESTDRTDLSLTALEKCLNEGLRSNYKMCERGSVLAQDRPAN